MNNKTTEIIPDSKICSKCKQEKPLDRFRKSKTGKYGVHGFCRECHSSNSKEKYQQNREKRILEVSFWAEQNPHKTAKYFDTWRKKKVRETRKLKKLLKDSPELLDRKSTHEKEDGEIPNF